MAETGVSESVIEQAALAWLESLGYTVLHGPEIAAGEPGAERTDPGYRRRNSWRVVSGNLSNA